MSVISPKESQVAVSTVESSVAIVDSFGSLDILDKEGDLENSINLSKMITLRISNDRTLTVIMDQKERIQVVIDP